MDGMNRTKEKVTLQALTPLPRLQERGTKRRGSHP